MFLLQTILLAPCSVKMCSIGLRLIRTFCYSLPSTKYYFEDEETTVQAYDLIMLIVLGMSIIFGAIKGLAWQVASLASIIVSYLVACRYRGQVAEMIDAQPPWNMFLAMLILYVGTGFVIWVGFRLMSSAIDKIRLKEFDRHLGALFGLGKGIIFCLLITMFAMTLLGPKQQSAICQSRSGYYISAILEKAQVILPTEVHSTIGGYLARLDSQLKQGQQGASLEPSQNLSDLSDGLKQLIPDSINGLIPQQLNPQQPGMVESWKLPNLQPAPAQTPAVFPDSLPQLPGGFSNGLRPSGSNNSAELPGGVVFPR